MRWAITTLKLVFFPILVILLTSFFILFWADAGDLEFLHYHLQGAEHSFKRFESLHNVLIIAFTFLLVCVAWVQIKSLSKIKRGEFLIELDGRLIDSTIIGAKESIHRFYLESKNDKKDAEEHVHRDYIAKKIDSLATDDNEECIHQYIQLLELLNLLETVAFYVNREYISIHDIDKLMSGSLNFYYEIFSLRVQNRNNKYETDYYYKEFERLIKKLRCINKRRCCFCIKCSFNCH